MSELESNILKSQLEQALRVAVNTGREDLIHKAFNDLLEKGVAANIGETRIWNGKTYRKVAAGDWEEVRPESRGGMGQMGGFSKPSSVGKDTYKPLLKPTEKKPKEKDESSKVMSSKDYKKTLNSLFTPGEDIGDAYDLARNVATDKQLVNRVLKDNPDIRTKNDLYQRIQWDIENLMSYKAMEDDLIKGGMETIVNAANALDDESIVEKAFNNIIEKGSKANIGEVRDWSGKKFRKVSEGKWVEVSEHGLTKQEHAKEYDASLKGTSKKHQMEVIEGKRKEENTEVSYEEIKRRAKALEDKQNLHLDAYNKLSGKEHSDEEVGVKKEQGSAFSDQAKFSNSDWHKWTEMAKQNKEIEVVKDGDLFLVYKNGNKHIGTYDSKRSVMMADDMKLFGNDVKVK